MYALTERLEELLGPVTGTNVNGAWLCPFHVEDTPSLSINQDTGLWQCFGCHERGGIKKLYRLLGKELDSDYVFQTLVKSVNRQPKQRADHTATANRLIANLTQREGRNHLRHYFETRPIDPSAADYFGIGFKPEGVDAKGKRRVAALALPYWDARGRAAGIKYRTWNGHKYSEDNSEYGLYNVRDAIGKPFVFITEGESDCHVAWSLMHDKGIGVVGTSGANVFDTQWSSFGLFLLSAKRIFLCYDNDEAGNKCAENAMQVLGSYRTVRVKPVKGKDLSAHIINGGSLVDLSGLEEKDRNLFTTGASSSVVAPTD